ncbi:MAG: methylmalonyl-CoA mutase small subunit [Bacteroidales bacterium]|nr:methylmalonyl-CoA mutase small subunit [Bacteroidales bacterium]
MADSKEQLFSEFPPVSTGEWMDKIVADLKGADFEKKLMWKTLEGFSVKPFYRAEDLQGNQNVASLPGQFPYVRGCKTQNHWYVRQEIDANDARVANTKALDILNKGADSICFVLSGNEIDTDFLKVLLNGICLECIELNFRTCYSYALNTARILADFVQSNNLDAGRIEASINFDPYKSQLTSGKKPNIEMEATLKGLLDVCKILPKLRVLGVNAQIFNNAGATASQELGYALAWGNEYIQQGVNAGLTPAQSAGMIKFNFGIGSNYFMEIAKFRAARLLWAKIVQAWAPEAIHTDAAKMRQHAFTSEWNLTVYDAHVNLLRTQTEAMSASIASVDSITVLPFDQPYKASDAFSERIARNQQLLLKEEAHFDKVADAAGGSYYIENLTQMLAEAAWKIFLTTDDQGGFAAAVEQGSIQQDINETGSKRRFAVSSRKEVLLGTNQYPNFNETASAKIQTPVQADNSTQVHTLETKRAATEFEALRLSTEKAAKRPTAFMLTIGPLNMRLARAQFSSNFFACAGYEIVDNLGFKTIEEGIHAARRANADIVVLCSGDEEYATFGPEALQAIGSGKEILVIAGAPACQAELQEQGIKHFINVRSNVLQTLQQFNQLVGIQ